MELIKDESLLTLTITLDVHDYCLKKLNHEGKPTKLSDVFNLMPYGHVIKEETGMGATYLELNTERNSIIVEPIKITASTLKSYIYLLMNI